MIKRLIASLSIVIFINIISQSPILLIKIPTRERPSQFFKCLDLYYKKLSGNHNVKFLISCDLNDIKMNNDTIKERFKKYENLVYVYANSLSKIHAYNRDLNSINKWDILLLTSDDMTPIAQDYDNIIIENMIKYFPNFDGVLKFNDGRSNSILNTLPIIGYKFFQRFNYLYHPQYKSFFCDLELTIVSKLLEKEAVIQQTIIRHDNPIFANKDKQAFKADTLYNKSLKWETVDKKVFYQRSKNHFDLKGITHKKFLWVDKLIKTWNLDK